MVAINFSSLYPNLESWEYFWRKVGGGEDVRLAQDTDQRAFTAFNVRGLGTTIIINRNGQVIYRDAGPTPYDTLRSQVDKALQRPRFDAARR